MLENVQCTTLRNGAAVITSQIKNAESVAFGILIGAGSRFEKNALAGASHFLEHMLFKGTPKRSALDISRAIESRGGYFNAFTQEDATCYHVRLPYEYMGEAVDVLMDMYLNASLRKEDFERERNVILEEMKMYQDQPQWVVQEKFQEAMYSGHPLGAPISGSEKSLQAMTPQSLHEYKNKMYIPSNTVFAFAGSLQHEQAVECVERALADKAKSTAPKFRPIDARVKQIPVTIVRKDVNQIQAILGFRIFGLHDDRLDTARVLNGLLGDNMSSRLFQSVREKHGLCYTIQSSIQFFDETGIFLVGSGFDSKQAVPALKLIVKELTKVMDKKVGSAELKRTKDYLNGAFRLRLESTNSQMMYLAENYMNYGKYIDPQERVKGIQKVTAEDIQRVASQIFEPSRMTLSLVLPNDQKEPDEYWLSAVDGL